MTLGKEAKGRMPDVSNQLFRNPEEFLQNYDKNGVISSLVILSEKTETCEFLHILAKCMKLYPHCWQYVKHMLRAEEPPFRPIIVQKDEPKVKRRKKGN